MMNANYNSENIARALGLSGFANDEMLGPAQQALRVLLTPSFTPEACLTFIRDTDAHVVRVHVVAAHFQIWHQVGPAPAPVLTDVAQGSCSADAFEHLVSLLGTAAEPGDVPRAHVILDGTTARSVLREQGQGIIDLQENTASTAAHSAFVDAALHLAWQSITSPRVRNALRPDLPPEYVPPDKPTVQTMVIGGEEEKALLLKALKQQHGI
jgi:hypothetical protein